MNNDTICAIATALSNSSIGIIRISGPDAKNIADRIFVDPKNEHTLASMESHNIRYGFLLDDDEILDEVLVSYFKAPKSFTAEDVVEINTHGGVYVIKKALESVIKAGARLAEPGEFTKRAFLNGRIDLSEAESVMDVISSSSDMALKSSVSVLRGSLYEKVSQIRDSIIHEAAYIESALDDPEHISLDGYDEKIIEVLNRSISETDRLIKDSMTGALIKDGINTVILGKPNAGKSSLLNMLAGSDRAIVTDIPGTTRDTIQERISFKDFVLNITDTAGIRDTDDVIEKIGIDKALKIADMSDLIIYVADTSVDLDENDRSIIKYLSGSEKRFVIFFNKNDLPPAFDENDLFSLFDGPDGRSIPVIKASILNNEGIDDLKDIITEMFFDESIDINNELIIANVRQREALINARSSLLMVMTSVNNGMSEDLYTIDLMNAYSSLGYIIGEEVDEDLINRIFSDFCMGK